MSNHRLLFVAFLAFSPVLALADNVLHPGTPVLDRPTLMTLGVKLPVTGDDNYNAKVSVRYHSAASTAWRDALPLYRVHPETVFAYAITPQFAGSIFDLRPNTAYTIELHVTDPDGPVDQTFTVTAATRPVPSGPATPRVRPVASTAELQAALGSAAAGDVITLANGTYAGKFYISASGTPENPIVVRGASQDGVILDGQNCDCNIIDVYGSYTQLENLSIRNGTRAIGFSNDGLIADVVRGVHVVNTRLGMASGNYEQDFYIADNILEGRLAWPLIYTDDDGAHSDDDGILMSGFGMVIAHNRISGYGDAMKNNHWGARALDVYGNEVLWSYDNCIELDVSEGNVRAMRNRFTNCSTPLSVQPVFAGPAYILRNVVTNTVDEQIKFHALNIASPPPQPNGVLAFHNTFVSAFTGFQVQTPYGSYHTTIENNIAVRPLNSPANAVNWDAPLHDAQFDYNGYYPDGPFLFGWDTGFRGYANFAALQAGGVEPHGLVLAAGIFASGLTATTDYRVLQPPADVTLSASSTALNRGIVLPNINDGFTGSAPDLGALEAGCPVPLFGPRPAGVDETNEPLGCEPGGNPTPPTGTAAFVKTDSTTQGNWQAAYGRDGAIVMGDNQSLPAYVTAAPANNFTFVWDPSTGDVRAPLKLASATDRIAACWGAANSFTVALNFTDGLTHQVAVYAMDWDNYFSRTETVDVVDANGVLLDSRPLAGFFSGQYLVWNLSGRVTLRVTNTNAQSNAVISGIFFGAGAGSPPPAATFVKTDTTTQGNWKSAYGSQGAIVVGDSSVLPAYAAVSTAGSGTFVWEQSTGDTRAPLKGASATDRIAACWVSLTSFTIAVNFTDGQPHQIALYALDWDNYFGRRQTVEILDAGGAVVDTRTQSDFTGGQYLVWKVNGPVTIRVTNNNGPSNAVVSGLFIDPGV